MVTPRLGKRAAMEQPREERAIFRGKLTYLAPDLANYFFRMLGIPHGLTDTRP
jgi:hypothetical protein